MIAYIYGLRHPETGFYHYIGKSNAPQRRLSQHRSTKLWAEMDILEVTADINGSAVEQKWIQWALTAGHPLTNHFDVPANCYCVTCGDHWDNSHIALGSRLLCRKSLRHHVYWKPRGQMKLFL
jgi:hypothetical protein